MVLGGGTNYFAFLHLFKYQVFWNVISKVSSAFTEVSEEFPTYNFRADDAGRTFM
jgi:hypothetical protein